MSMNAIADAWCCTDCIHRSFWIQIANKLSINGCIQIDSCISLNNNELQQQMNEKSQHKTALFVLLVLIASEPIQAVSTRKDFMLNQNKMIVRISLDQL
jgi:hypothetical protein